MPKLKPAKDAPDRRAVTQSIAGLLFAGLPARAGSAAATPCGDFADAFHFGFPIFEFARSAHRQNGASAARGQTTAAAFTHRATLSDHLARAVTTPNNDTIYSSARLDLTNGPALIEIPDVDSRYFCVAFMNAFTDNFAYAGTRATGGAGGRFLIAGPRWNGNRPADAIVIRSLTDDVWALARIGVAGADDLAAAAAVQQQVKVLSAAAPSPMPVEPVSATDAGNFTAVVSAMLQRMDAHAITKMKRRLLEEVGLSGPSGLTDRQRRAWRAIIPTALQSLAGGFDAGGAVINGWRYPPAGVGEDSAPDILRAATALSGLAALGREEAMYIVSHSDATGLPLDGARSYRLSLPARIPAKALWSLSIYRIEPDGRLFFFDNPIGRYSIGDRTPQLRRRADGGVNILISPAPAAALADENWLPAIGGPIRLVFRLYLPERVLLSGNWRLSPIALAP